MRLKHVLVTGTLIVLMILVFFGFVYSQGNVRSGFSSPLPGDTIKERTNFNVSMQIGDFDPSTGHYWVAVASVKGFSDNWERTLELYSKSRDNQNLSRKELNRLIGNWQINQFWPKFYVPKSPFHGTIHEGGNNPLYGIEPQPMVLIIVKVDDRMQNIIKRWFRKGAETGSYPGFSASDLSKNMVIARCEIFFP